MPKSKSCARPTDITTSWTAVRPKHVKRVALDDPTGGSTPKGRSCSMIGQRGAKGPKKGCPAQMIYRDGVPHIRFCVAPKKPGFVVPVRDGLHAKSVADCMCGVWSKLKGEGINENRYAAAFEEAVKRCGQKRTLGDIKRKRRKKR